MQTITSAGIQTSGTTDESTDEVRTEGPILEFTEPTLVPEELLFCEASLWERPIADNVEPWLLPALQHAIAVTARGASLTVTCANSPYITLQRHVCDELGFVSQSAVECATDDLPIGTVSGHESTGFSIPQRVTLAESTASTSHADD